VAELPAEAAAEREVWERDGILSVLSVPMSLRGRVVGFLGFDMERCEKTWPEELIVLLRLVGESFARALDRRDVEEKLEDERRFSDSMISALPGLFYLFDKEGRLLRWNERVSRETGFDDEELGQMHPVDFVADGDREGVRESMREALTEGEATLEAEIVTKEGRRIPYFFSGRRVALAGEPYLVGLGIDITQRRRIEESLRESEVRFRQIAEHIEEAFWLETAEGETRFLYVNPGFEKLWDLDQRVLLADRQRFFDRIYEYDRARLRQAMDGGAGGNGDRAITFRILSADGVLRWVWAKIFPVRDDAGRVIRRAGLAMDVTERKLAELKLRAARRRLSRLAGTDPLTGLPNRRAMLDKLNYELRRYARSNAAFTVILGDIDKFKSINDRYGHETGDRVLRAVGDLMRGVVRNQDTVARWGGEEFMLLLPDTDLAGGEIVAEKLRRAVADLSLSRGEAAVSVSITLGLSSYEGEGDVQSCIRRADDALYEGKALGGDRTVLARHGSGDARLRALAARRRS
jgi:diguanylate cyclase (GGDEF)-like protein/PAS domain S-box-containing protein